MRVGRRPCRVVQVATEDVRRVPREDAKGASKVLRSRVDVPEVQIFIVRRRGQVPTVGRPRAVRASLLVPHQRDDELPVRHVPYLYRLVRGGGGELGAARGELDARHALAVSLQLPREGEVGRRRLRLGMRVGGGGGGGGDGGLHRQRGGVNDDATGAAVDAAVHISFFASPSSSSSSSADCHVSLSLSRTCALLECPRFEKRKFFRCFWFYGFLSPATQPIISIFSSFFPDFRSNWPKKHRQTVMGPSESQGLQ